MSIPRSKFDGRRELAFGARIVLELPQKIMAKVEENVRRYDGSNQWFLPSYDRSHHREPMSTSRAMHMITEEVRLQGISMTCRSIRLEPSMH